MTKYLVFGHKNPDTDTIASAITMAYFLEKSGEEAEPVALGTPNDETQFALETFNCEAPRVIEAINGEVDHVALVDHNEPVQSVADLNTVTVDYVVDHHRISGFETGQPLFYRAEPVGCTATILYKMFKENAMDIPHSIAGLMVSAIISDTLLFKSPTCTQQDKDAAVELANAIGLDLEDYGMKLLKSGTNMADKSDSSIINDDAKNFDMAGKNVRIGQVNVVDHDEILSRKDAILAQMAQEKADKGYDLSLLVVTNILTSDSIGFVVGDDTTNVEKAFNNVVEGQQIALPGIVSRKKQVVPPLTEAFNH